MKFIDQYAILTPRLRAKFEAWANDRRGAAAVEFAFVAIPLFFLIFGLLEISTIFIISTVLEFGVAQAAREIRTGQFQSTSAALNLTNAQALQQFENSICQQLFNLLPCQGRIFLDVQPFNSFSAATTTNPIVPNPDLDGDGQPDGGPGSLNTASFTFSPGGANQIVVVRVFYEWELITPLLPNLFGNSAQGLANLNDNKHLIQSTVAFRNEPFS